MIQARLDDFFGAFREKTTVTLPGSISQRSVSPGSIPKCAATDSGTVVRTDSDRFSERTALDSTVLATDSPLTLFSGRLKNYSLHVGLPLGRQDIQEYHVGQHRGRHMPKGNLPSNPESRGRVIAGRPGWVERSVDEGVYYVRDLATRKTKVVRLQSDAGRCSCRNSSGGCEHVHAALAKVRESEDRETTIQFIVDEWNSPEIQQAYRKGQEAEFLWFDPLLGALLDMVPEPPRPPGRRGAKPTPLGEALFVAVKKSHLRLSLSRLKGMFSEDLNMGRLTSNWNYSRPARTLGRADITPILIWAIRETAKPLAGLEEGGTAAIDSTGLSTSVFGAYYPQAHKVCLRREFIKVHASVLTRTNAVADVIVTDNRGANSPQFIPLLRGTVEAGFRPEYAVADKAYLSRKNLQGADDLRLKPRIPFKENSTPAPRGYRIWRSLYHLAQVDPAGYADAYHQRSNVEAAFSALKRQLGESVLRRRPVARVNEALCKILCYNLLTLIRHFVARGIDLAPLFKDALRTDGPGGPASGISSSTGGRENIRSTVKNLDVFGG